MGTLGTSHCSPHGKLPPHPETWRSKVEPKLDLAGQQRDLALLGNQSSVTDLETLTSFFLIDLGAHLLLPIQIPKDLPFSTDLDVPLLLQQI